MPARRQLSFDDLGTPLAEATLVVVDLETTGTDPAADAITEIGAVKVRGGEVLGEFRTFVDPQRPIPAYIASLTGITEATVAGAPTIDVVLPMFLDFAAGAALVAHNARFDVGFLRAQAAACELTWPGPAVIDTLALARRVFGRDEVRDHRLSTLARHVEAAITPDHRALSDARATVDVLHALIARLGPAGASTLEDLASAHRRASPVQLRKKHLAETVPSVPGVYQFLDAQGAVLYVGTSRNLRSRVRTYFTAAERRRKVLDMLPRAESVRVIECATATEAAVRELRLIAREKPPSNRHGLHPETAHWLRLGPGSQGLRAARLAKGEDDGSAQIGPLTSRHDAEPLRGLLTEAVMGPAARFDAARSSALSGGHRDRVRKAMTEDPDEVLAHVAARLRARTEAGRYEEAEGLRRLAATYLTAARRASRLRALAAVPLLITARPSTEAVIGGRGWELLAVRHGRFSGTTLVAAGKDPVPFARSLAMTGLGEAELAAPLCQGYHQEAEILLAWLEGDGVRTVLVEGSWRVPARARFEEDALARRFAATATPSRA
ncbi:DEDD exonuclease domain-containing protein [Brachybacterium saurashtrense]|uniref:DEDD exnuclease domain-containing protein n=1 Tax=Brachybacterium saurashtrense TaxID=556288 RepID=A0A345YM08_9MICO|nr:DEDD exonuclease domain-containing protein [Brachybacterium saurashtrense]AXK44960.1 DEDD exnuclease domain-containing protein [Brachybacterium saurashtrense]RRR21644.1 DEDD exnuclease domain-containing protein [Brachybacterium saurashtrense]